MQLRINGWIGDNSNQMEYQTESVNHWLTCQSYRSL